MDSKRRACSRNRSVSALPWMFIHQGLPAVYRSLSNSANSLRLRGTESSYIRSRLDVFHSDEGLVFRAVATASFDWSTNCSPLSASHVEQLETCCRRNIHKHHLHNQDHHFLKLNESILILSFAAKIVLIIYTPHHPSSDAPEPPRLHLTRQGNSTARKSKNAKSCGNSVKPCKSTPSSRRGRPKQKTKTSL